MNYAKAILKTEKQGGFSKEEMVEEAEGLVALLPAVVEPKLVIMKDKMLEARKSSAGPPRVAKKASKKEPQLAALEDL